MMYIQESLAPGEKILKFTQYHWLYVALSALSASIFILLAFALLFVGTIYHYYDIVKVPPWKIFLAAKQLSIGDYIKAVWHINILIRVGAFLLFLMAIIQIGARILVRVTTEMGVTNRRVVFKRGLISRKVEEMRVDFIDGADVDQGIMGRIFNYGAIKMYGTGAEGIIFPYFMEDPVNFKRAIQAARAVQISGNGQSGPRHQVQTEDSYQPAHPLHQQHQQYNSELRQQEEEIRRQNFKPRGPAVSAEELKHIVPPGEPDNTDLPPGSRVRRDQH